jgi:hypothetical protein
VTYFSRSWASFDLVSGRSRSSPGQILGDPEQVLGKSRTGLVQVSIKSWVDPKQVPDKSGQVPVKSRVDPRQVSGMSRSSPNQVLSESR